VPGAGNDGSAQRFEFLKEPFDSPLLRRSAHSLLDTHLELPAEAMCEKLQSW